MSTIQEIETAIERLPRDQIREIREWLEDLFEDELEFTDEFKASIERGEQDIAEGRVRRKN
jgi:hypothetical protein